MRADLAQFYSGLNYDDVWTGRVSAYHVIILTEQLLLNPHSRVFALRGGNADLQGWDVATVVAARAHNLLAGLIAGLSKGVDLESLLITYPTAEVAAPPTPMTLAEFSVSGFQQFMYGEG